MKKLVYVCSPLRGDIENNIKKAERYCREIVKKYTDVFPFAPHIYCTRFLDDTIPEEREKGITLGNFMLDKCDELWVFGVQNLQEASTGMKAEIQLAKTLGIPVRMGMELNSESKPEPEPKTESVKNPEEQNLSNEHLTEVSKMALEIADRYHYKSLSMKEKVELIAQTFGRKTGKIGTSPCSGKWRGTSDIFIEFDNGESLPIGNAQTKKAKTKKMQSQCVDSTFIQYNPDFVKYVKTAALPALLQWEEKDNAVAAEKGLKPYTLLNIEFNTTGDYKGWYYVTLEIDGKIIAHITTNLSFSIKGGGRYPSTYRPGYFVAGALREEEVDYVFHNTGFSSTSALYKLPLTEDARKRAEITLKRRQDERNE